MEDDPVNIRELARQLENGIIAAQAMAVATYSIMNQILPDVAKLHDDPKKYLSSLFDRVAPSLERIELVHGGEELAVQSAARTIFEGAFTQALQRFD